MEELEPTVRVRISLLLYLFTWDGARGTAAGGVDVMEPLQGRFYARISRRASVCSLLTET